MLCNHRYIYTSVTSPQQQVISLTCYLMSMLPAYSHQQSSLKEQYPYELFLAFFLYIHGPLYYGIASHYSEH